MARYPPPRRSRRRAVAPVAPPPATTSPAVAEPLPDTTRRRRTDACGKLPSSKDFPAERVAGGLSIWHWLIVLLVVVLIFGTKRLTSGAKDLGTAVKEFKKAMREDEPRRRRRRTRTPPRPSRRTTTAIRRSCADALARPARCSTSVFPNWS